MGGCFDSLRSPSRRCASGSRSRSNARQRPDGRCAGTLRVERGRTNLVNKAFRVTADRFRSVSARLKKSDYRRLKRSKKGRQVKITMLTRDAAGTLRQASATVRMRAKR